MLGLSPDTQSDVIAFSRKVSQINPPEITLNKANVMESDADFLDLHLSIVNGCIKTIIYDKRDDFNFDIDNYPHLDWDVPRATSYGVYLSQLIRYARASSNVEDFNYRNKVITVGR
jgi:hypothetical protein